jgi:TonB family protein
MVFAVISHAQDTLISYFNNSWIGTTKDKAEYYRKQFKENNGWGIIVYYKSGTVQMKGVCSDDACNIQNGTFTWYNKNGIIGRSVNYVNGKKTGEEVLYYTNGNKQLESNYKMDRWDGECIGYYESGKVSARAQYKNGEQVSGNYFNEDGTPNKSITVFYRAASFPAAEGTVGQYLSKNLAYPKSAEKNNKQGQVVVDFIVKKDGSIDEITISKTVDPALDKEALRVIKKMPKWTPAIAGGLVSDSYMKQPITFTFQ